MQVLSSSLLTLAWSQGFALGGTLILAIGAQNAFVLRQGLQRAHVGAVVLVCVVSDAALIALGVAGIGTVLQRAPGLTAVLTAFGAVFLFAYGLRALWRARRPAAVSADGAAMPSRRAVLLQAAAFTFLNPHVYLDTVLLVGSIGARQPGALKWWFVAGAAMASATWFSALGYAARWMSGWFANPRAWQVLDALVGLTMLALAAALLMSS